MRCMEAALGRAGFLHTDYMNLGIVPLLCLISRFLWPVRLVPAVW